MKFHLCRTQTSLKTTLIKQNDVRRASRLMDAHADGLKNRKLFAPKISITVDLPMHIFFY